MPDSRGPSAWKVEQAISTAQAFAAQLQQEASFDEDHEALLLAIDSETDAVDILRKAVRAALEAKAMEAAIDSRMEALQARKRRYVARKDALRGLAQGMMEALGMPKLEEPDFTISITAGKPKAIITDPDALPELMVRVKREPDMSTINAAIKAGQLPPGVELSNQPDGVTIRTK